MESSRFAFIAQQLERELRTDDVNKTVVVMCNTVLFHAAMYGSNSVPIPGLDLIVGVGKIAHEKSMTGCFDVLSRLAPPYVGHPTSAIDGFLCNGYKLGMNSCTQHGSVVVVSFDEYHFVSESGTLARTLSRVERFCQENNPKNVQRNLRLLRRSSRGDIQLLEQDGKPYLGIIERDENDRYDI
jgi:hypothetical protein